MNIIDTPPEKQAKQCDDYDVLWDTTEWMSEGECMNV